jgi:hypothetical protein
MQILTIRQQQATARIGMGRRYGLEGDARPGDVLALAGGALVRDRNENGLVDGADAPLDAPRFEGADAPLDAPRFDGAGAPRGTRVDIRV